MTKIRTQAAETRIHGIEGFLNRKSLESVVKSVGNFVLSFTGTLSLAELRPSVEHEIPQACG